MKGACEKRFMVNFVASVFMFERKEGETRKDAEGNGGDVYLNCNEKQRFLRPSTVAASDGSAIYTNFAGYFSYDYAKDCPVSGFTGAK